MDWIESIPSTSGGGWKSHRHLARWLVRALQPRTIVNLGIDHGYSTFCWVSAALQGDPEPETETGISRRHVHAYDTFDGDDRQTYMENLLEEHPDEAEMVTVTNNKSFVEAAASWPLGAIADIIHLDGGDHTSYAYETTRDALAAWLPFLSAGGAIVVHGIYISRGEGEEAFEAYKAYNDFLEEHPDFHSLYFETGSGIGVLSRNKAGLMDKLFADYHQHLFRGPVQFPLAIPAPPPAAAAQPPADVFGFYHVCAVFNWEEVVDEQIKTLVDSGLYERATSIFYVLVGTSLDSMERAQKKFAALPKFRLVFYSTDASEYERTILNFMHQHSSQQQQKQGGKPCYYFYLHSKGVSEQHQGESRSVTRANIAQWRQMMQFFLFEQWEACVAALETRHVCGVNWRTWPMRHFSGNFWWARSDYVATLSSDEIGPGYYEPEAWLGMGRPSVSIQHTTKLDHYFSEYPRERYAPVSLEKRRDTIEGLLKGTIAILNRNNVEHFISYGTMLGWRREGRVILHDDDGDLVLNGVYFARILALRDEFAEAGLHLVSFGRDVDYRKIIQVRSHTNQPVVDKDESGFIDIYFCEQRSPHITDHWNFWCFLETDVHPLKEIEFLGQQTFVPRNHDAILEVLYGEDFLTPVKGKKFKPIYEESGFARLYKKSQQSELAKPDDTTSASSSAVLEEVDITGE